MTISGLADGVFVPARDGAGRSCALAPGRPLAGTDGDGRGTIEGGALTRRRLLWAVLAALSLAVAAASCGRARGVPLLESSCENAQDDDADLMADCTDPDCSANPACARSR